MGVSETTNISPQKGQIQDSGKDGGGGVTVLKYNTFTGTGNYFSLLYAVWGSPGSASEVSQSFFHFQPENLLEQSLDPLASQPHLVSGNISSSDLGVTALT